MGHRANTTPHQYIGGGRMKKLRVVDLFAGIGGFRLGVEQAADSLELETVCAMSVEIDKLARKTYENNFTSERVWDDIRTVPDDAIPEHDLLLAGFPCQPFSTGGRSTKKFLGRETGFKDPDKGTLFDEVVRFIKHGKPKAFILENVKGLLSSHGGTEMQYVLDSLVEAGYAVRWGIVDAARLVPQHRERLFFVGIREELIQTSEMAWVFDIPDRNPKFREIMETDLSEEDKKRYTLRDKTWKWLQEHKERHRAKGNGFGFSFVDPEEVTRTLSNRYHKDGSEILIMQGGRNPRKLTIREASKLMGFPDSFIHADTPTRVYQQLGNSVVVPVVKIIATHTLKILLQKGAI